MPTGLVELSVARAPAWYSEIGYKILKRNFLAWPILGLLLFPASAQQTLKEMSEKSLEDLMNIEVTSVSKKPQPMSKVASAIFVIRQEDIRNSGAVNISGLLRMVPGLDVAQINAHSWAISARGLNEEFANKLLVLIDGRTVYSPLFAGVYWDVQDLPLEDLDRIEVIRGPGATVWGANAVNGVINIITKPAKETQGALIVIGGGTHERAFGMAQYGGRIRNSVTYRIFAKGLDKGPFSSVSGLSGYDQSDLLHSGFRVDASISKKNLLTLEGDIYKGGEGKINNLATLTPPFASLVKSWSRASGGNLLGRWNHNFSPHSDTELQIYFDGNKRNTLIYDETVKAIDVNFQHHFQKGSRHDVVWGAEYRHFSYRTRGTFFASFVPESAGHDLISSFVQDEIVIKPDSVYLTLGAKFEHNDFSGFEFQPSIRVAWSLTKNHTLWAAYSRARRTPALLDRSVESNFRAFPGPGGIPTVLNAQGSPTTISEHLDAFEAGYRSRILANFSLDLATFYNRYTDLQTLEPGIPFVDNDPPPLHVEVPFFYANNMHGETHGFEAAAKWKVTGRWTLSPGYTFEQIHLHLSATSQDPTAVPAGEGNSPRHQAQLRSNVVIRKGFEWNASLYFVDRLQAQMVPAYTRLDTGLAWQVSPHVAIDVVGQNLLKNQHLEANSKAQSDFSGQIKRSVYAKLVWVF
ncbi:MAG TPA: TonB-dependent receptor [Candidatus Dormibacteraeota bacterium]|nr:TonB-dependent receptor [Candidatus Dormibacteraeota bacterium]